MKNVRNSANSLLEILKIIFIRAVIMAGNAHEVNSAGKMTIKMR